MSYGKDAKCIVAYLLKARSVESKKQPLLGNCCVTHNNEVAARRNVFCVVRAEAL
jgi:hypothetical protein